MSLSTLDFVSLNHHSGVLYFFSVMMTNEGKHLFISSQTFGFPLLWSACSHLSPFLNIGCASFSNWFVGVLYILWVYCLSDMWSAKISQYVGLWMRYFLSLFIRASDDFVITWTILIYEHFKYRGRSFP